MNLLETAMAIAPTPIKKLTPTEPIAAPPAPPKRLREGAVQILEHYNAIWCAIAPHDHTLADALKPEYAGLRYERMRPFDEIWIRHAGGDWQVKMLILKIDPVTKAIFTTVLPGYPLHLKDVQLGLADLSQARIDHVESGWRVILGSDILVDGLGAEGDALAWLAKKKLGAE